MSSRPWHSRLLPPWLAGRLPSAWRPAGTGMSASHGAAGDVPDAITAVMLGDTCSVVRVERDASGQGLQLSQAGSGSAQDLRQLKAAGWFDRSQTLLVLSSEQRHFLPLDRPEIPLDELGLAARYPLAEALDVDPDSLLCTAVPMPQINETLRPQMLGVAAQLDAVRQQLATLRAAGIDCRHIDTTDSALRGMSLLRSRAEEGTVALAVVGNDICIGLIWHHQFCALRSLALPSRAPGEDAYFEEQLALHIQRTTDHFERQATRLAVRSVLACMPSLGLQASANVLSALPLSTFSFELASVMAVAAEAGRACQNHNDLHALACVAAARLLQPLAVQAAEAAAALTHLASAGHSPLAYDMGSSSEAPATEPSMFMDAASADAPQQPHAAMDIAQAYESTEIFEADAGSLQRSAARPTAAHASPYASEQASPFSLNEASLHPMQRDSQPLTPHASLLDSAHEERYDPLLTDPAAGDLLRTASPAALSRSAIEQAAQRSSWGRSFAGGSQHGPGLASRTSAASSSSASRSPFSSGGLDAGMGLGGGYHGGSEFDLGSISHSGGSPAGTRTDSGYGSGHGSGSPSRLPPVLNLEPEWPATQPASESLEAELAEWLDAQSSGAKP